jgi:hypothetical protein
MTMVRGGVLVPVRIWFGPAVINGEEQDRGHDWRCEIDGRTDLIEGDRAAGYWCRVALPIDRAWPYCARRPITAAEYQYLVAHAGWAREHAPDHPKAQPRKPVDFNTIRLPF